MLPGATLSRPPEELHVDRVSLGDEGAAADLWAGEAHVPAFADRGTDDGVAAGSRRPSEHPPEGSAMPPRLAWAACAGTG